MNYFGKTVSKTARNLYNAEQTPNFDFDTDDFAIALLRGGKGLPDLGWEEVKSEATQKINQIAEVVMENIRGKNIVGSIKGDNIKMGDRTEAK